MAGMATRREMVSIGLIAAALVLGGLWLVDKDKPTTKEQAARAGLLLRVFRQDEITRISIDRREPQGSQHIELVREGDQWKLTSPRVGPAEFMAVTSLLNELQGARAERSLGQVTNPSERAQLGLDAPRARIEIAMKGVTLKLALGGAATGGDANDAGATESYVEIAPYADEKGGVYVVPPDVAAALARGADAYRAPSLVMGNLSVAYQKVDVSGYVTLERGPYGTWRIPAGVPAAPVRADVDVVDRFFVQVSGLVAQPFVPDSTAVDVSKGATLTANLLSGGTMVVAFGGPCPVDPKLVVVQRKVPSIETGCVPQVITDSLKTPAAEYVDRHAFALLYGSELAKTSEIELVTIDGGGAKVLEIERSGAGMVMRVPTVMNLSNEVANAYLGRLARVAGDVVAPPPPLADIGLAPPAGKITLRRLVDPHSMAGGGDGGSVRWDQVVEIGLPVASDPAHKDGTQVVYLHRLDDGAILRVPFTDASALRSSAVYDLRSPNLLDVPADAITRIHASATTAKDGIAWDLQKKGGLWTMVTPPGLGADAESSGKHATDAATLTCVRWAESKDDVGFGLTPPRATLDVEREPKDDAGAATMTIEIGADAPDGVYARVRGHDPVCVLPAGKVEALLRPPFDARNVAFDPTLTPRVVITHDKRVHTLVFDTAAKIWREGADAGTPGTAATALAGKLADSVHDLRALGVVHLGPARKDEGLDAPTLVVEGFDGAASKKKLLVGGTGKFEKTDVYFARVQGTDAVYAIAKRDVDAILENL